MKTKTTLITGGGSGIGATLTKNLIAKGEVVVTLGLDLPNWKHDNLISYQADLTDTEQTNEAAQLISSSHKINNIVHNAGMILPNLLPKVKTDDILTLSLEYKTKNELLLNLNFKSIGDIYANNSNTVLINNSNTLNIKIGKEFQLSKTSIYPFFIINNIFENNYYDNIRINAFGGRYYEPAPKRTIFGGIRITL